VKLDGELSRGLISGSPSFYWFVSLCFSSLICQWHNILEEKFFPNLCWRCIFFRRLRCEQKCTLKLGKWKELQLEFYLINAFKLLCFWKLSSLELALTFDFANIMLSFSCGQTPRRKSNFSWFYLIWLKEKVSICFFLTVDQHRTKGIRGSYWVNPLWDWNSITSSERSVLIPEFLDLQWIYWQTYASFSPEVDQVYWLLL